MTMKHLAATVAAFAIALIAQAQTRVSVTVDTNGVILWPTNLFSRNVDLINYAVTNSVNATNVPIVTAGTNTVIVTNGLIREISAVVSLQAVTNIASAIAGAATNGGASVALLNSSSNSLLSQIQAATNGLGAAAFYGTNTFDLAGTAAAKATAATNALGSAAFYGTNAFDLAGTAASKLAAATNGLGSAAYQPSSAFQPASANLTGWAAVSAGNYVTAAMLDDSVTELESLISSGGEATNVLQVAAGSGISVDTNSLVRTVNVDTNTIATRAYVGNTVPGILVDNATHATTADSATTLGGVPSASFARTNAAAASSNGLLTSAEFNRLYVSTMPQYGGHSSQFSPLNGINTWYQFGADVSQTGVVAQATQMLTNGLFAAGYRTYMFDGGTFNGHDPVTGFPSWNTNKFPNGIPWLFNWLRTNGFKIGVYAVASADSGTDTFTSYGLEGHEVSDARWFLTNHVEYFKFDGPDVSYNANGISVSPNTYSILSGTTNPPGLGRWDQVLSKAVTELKKADYPVFISCAIDDYPRANIAGMFNSWRMTGSLGTNILGDTIGGDVTSGNIFPIQMQWVNYGLKWRQWWGPWHYADLDPIDYGHINTFEGEKTFLALRALFGASIQFGTLVPNFDTGYTLWNKRLVRHITLWTNQMLFTIAADAGYQAPKSNAVVNGVWQYSRSLGSANSSNQFVLAVNRNYTATNTGAGSASLSQTLSADGLRYTNSFSAGGTNKTYVFYATNSVIYWTNFGYSATQPILVKDIWNGGEAISVGSLDVSLYPQGSAAFTVRPGSELSLAKKGKVYLSDMPYFSRTNFYISAGGDISLDTQLGHPIAVGRSATEYSKGIGIQTSQRLDYGVWGATRFHATVGENYYKSAAISGSSTVAITFSVLADGVEIWNSGSMTRLNFSTNIDLNISGATNMTLLALATGGTPGTDDFGAWADAWVYFPQFSLDGSGGSAGQVLVIGTNNVMGWVDQASGNVTLAGNNAFTGDNTHSGTETFSGTVVLPASTVGTNDAVLSEWGDFVDARTIEVASFAETGKTNLIGIDENTNAIAIDLATLGSGGGGGSQTPFTSDINANQHALTNLSELKVEGAGVGTIATGNILLERQTLVFTGGTNIQVDFNYGGGTLVLTTNAYLTQPLHLSGSPTNYFNYTLYLAQDSTGGRAVSYDTNYWKASGAVLLFTTNALAQDRFSIIPGFYGTNAEIVGISLNVR